MHRAGLPPPLAVEDHIEGLGERVVRSPDAQVWEERGVEAALRRVIWVEVDSSVDGDESSEVAAVITPPGPPSRRSGARQAICGGTWMARMATSGGRRTRFFGRGVMSR